MLKATVYKYQLLVNNLAQLMEISEYKNYYLAQQIGLTPSNFSVKKRKKNWTTEEVSKIVAIIKNEKVENFMEGLIINSKSKNSFITAASFEKRMGWK